MIFKNYASGVVDFQSWLVPCWALSCIWKCRAMAVMWKGLTDSTYFSSLSQRTALANVYSDLKLPIQGVSRTLQAVHSSSLLLLQQMENWSYFLNLINPPLPLCKSLTSSVLYSHRKLNYLFLQQSLLKDGCKSFVFCKLNKPVDKKLKRAVILFPSFLWVLSIWSPALRRPADNWTQCSSRDPDWHQMEQHN